MKILCKPMRGLPTALLSSRPPSTLPWQQPLITTFMAAEKAKEKFTVCQRSRHRLRLPLALNFPLFLFFPSFFSIRRIFFFLLNEKLLSIKYLLSRRILWHKSRRRCLPKCCLFFIMFPSIRCPSEFSWGLIEVLFVSSIGSSWRRRRRLQVCI